MTNWWDTACALAGDEPLPEWVDSEPMAAAFSLEAWGNQLELLSVLTGKREPLFFAWWFGHAACMLHTNAIRAAMLGVQADEEEVD